MTPTADPRRRMAVALTGIVVAALTAVSVAIAWVFSPPALPNAPTMTMPVASVVAASAAPVDAQAWTVTLWRPLVDTPSQSAANTAPLKLFSILRRGDELIAALDADQTGLVYARVGDVVNGCRIDAVEADAIVLSQGEHRQRLELAP